MKRYLVLALLLILTACAMPYRPGQVHREQTSEADPEFPGIIGLASQDQQRPVDVLLVHGMCSHADSWGADAINKLIADMKLTEGGVEPYSPEHVDGISLTRRTVESNVGTIRFVGLVWSSLTKPLKTQLCFDQTTKSKLCEEAGESEAYFPTRATLNARFKDTLLNDCLADALIYQGIAREEIKRRMREALLAAMGDRPGDSTDAPLVVISESLGSKVLFDTLNDMRMEHPSTLAAQAAQRTVDRLAVLFMHANQIPILSLAQQGLPAEGVRESQQPEDSLQELLGARSSLPPSVRSRSFDRLVIVAFTDPNDLLSYVLPRERYETEKVKVVNILVSNASTLVGKIENPNTAHRGYSDNPDVPALMGCGMPRSRACR